MLEVPSPKSISTVIDDTYIFLGRLDSCPRHQKMVFLVCEIESQRRFVLKFYKQEEQHAYADEVNRNRVLITGSHVQKAIKHVTARLNMPPVHLGDQVYDFYSYIILPYCSKGTLLDLIMESNKVARPFSQELSLYLIKELLLNLQFLHDQNKLAHLDVKPDNVVITDDYKLSLIDFGHTNWKHLNLSHMVGTAAYNPAEVTVAVQNPRQCSFNAESVDIFQAGVTIFMVIFGSVPFHKADPRDSLYTYICNNRFDLFLASHPVTRMKIISPALCNLLRAMLHYDPRRRPTISWILGSKFFQNINMTKELS